MPHSAFKTLVIVGPGLIGGSLGMAVRAERMAQKVIGVGHRQASLDAAIAAGAIDEGTLDLLAPMPDADLVVLAAGIDQIVEQASAVIPRMKPGAVLTDVGSVKSPICAAVAAAGASERGVRFVGGHPLAGSEQRGIQAARRGLFRDARCLLTPTAQTDPEALAMVRRLWEHVGARVRELDPETHDRLVAEMSHMPHAVATCMVNAISDEALDLAATGFMDTTRVASGDPELWRGICMANRQALSAALRSLATKLEGFSRELDEGNDETILKRLAEARARRDARSRPS